MINQIYPNKKSKTNQHHHSTKIFYGMTREQAERVVQGLYSNLLFRGYTDGENEAIVHGLEYDMSRIEAFESIRSSEEHQKKALIVDCYLVM